MSTLVAMDAAAVSARPRPSTAALALLGCGTVGSAIVRLLAASRTVAAHVDTVLVRNSDRQRAVPSSVPFTTSPQRAISADAEIVVEALGGTEPARALVLEALARRIPVVTANKTLLAYHGAELRRASRAAATPLVYEAAVLAGVPFLGTFARRPLAAEASSLLGIVNGTTNYLLTRAAAEGISPAAALPDAQRLGYAEADPSKDVSGADAAEKLAVLLQHFAHLDVHPESFEVRGITGLEPWTIAQARELGGVIKPIVAADWTQEPAAFVGPAFVPATHPLSRVDGVENAVLLECRRGRLLFQGPGAGPDVTAATVLDDVAEILDGTAAYPAGIDLRRSTVRTPDSSWLISLSGSRLPAGADAADYLGSFGLYLRSTSAKLTASGEQHRACLTWPASTASAGAAAARLAAASGCLVTCTRALGELE